MNGSYQSLWIGHKKITSLSSITYSWIDHWLEIGLTLALLLSVSDFKSKTSFGVLAKNYRGQVFDIFVKPFWWDFVFWYFVCFSKGSGSQYSRLSLKLIFLLRRAIVLTRITCVNLVCAYKCSKIPQNLMFCASFSLYLCSRWQALDQRNY